MYWNSVSTFGAHLSFQYHCCEEIVYFSRDFSTAFIHIIQYTEVTANQLKSNRCFHCARMKSMYWDSVSTFDAHLQFQYHCCEEIVYFSRDFSTTFIQYIHHTEVTANQLKSNRCFHCADSNRCTEIQYPLFGHIFNFSTTALKRQSTFQGILVLLSFNITNIPMSKRPSWSQTDYIIVQDSNRCTEIQFPLLGTSSISVPLDVKR